MVTSNGVNSETEWHADLRATHNVTNDLGNLNLKSKYYNALDHVQVRNGPGLHIANYWFLLTLYFQLFLCSL